MHRVCNSLLMVPCNAANVDFNSSCNRVLCFVMASAFIDDKIEDIWFLG
jgi:hypothetical protein